MSKVSGKIAKRYAKALFDAVNKADLDAYDSALTSLANTIKTLPALQDAVSNPAYKLSDRMNVAGDVASKINPSLSGFKNFAQLLIENGRFLNLPEISEVFSKTVSEYKKLLSLDITTAFTINDGEKNELSQKLEKQFGKIMLNWEVDSSILGGMRVSSGDKLFDSSVRGALDSISEKLMKA